MSEATSDVRVDQRGQALWLTIDREEKRNAMDDGVLHALREGVEEAGRRPGIRAVGHHPAPEPRCSAPAAT